MARSWEASRERVSGRITGQLLSWQGKYGWIKPLATIDHPGAGKRGGKVYLGQEDVEAEVEVKGIVSFIAYADGTGLGAMHCRPATPGQIQASSAGKGKGKDKNGETPSAGKGKSGAARTGAPSAASRPTPTSKPTTVATTNGGGIINGTVLKTILKQPVGRGRSAAILAGQEEEAEVEPEVEAPEEEEVEEEAPEEEVVEEEAPEDAPEDEAAEGGPKKRGAPPPPDKTLRERLLPNRIVGKLIKWRGHTGFIRPNAPIDHPDAETFKKNMFVHESDVQNGHVLYQGAQVSFFLYNDSHGVGAEKVILTKDQPVSTRFESSQEEPLAPWRKAKGKGKGGDAGLKRKRFGKGAEDGAPREKRPSGPDLDRERITDIPVSGEVVEWKRNFGWVRASEAVEHEKASGHDGKIYLHQKDIVPEGPLEVGQQVDFHVYADASGLGAEECIVTG